MAEAQRETENSTKRREIVWIVCNIAKKSKIVVYERKNELIRNKMSRVRQEGNQIGGGRDNTWPGTK